MRIVLHSFGWGWLTKDKRKPPTADLPPQDVRHLYNPGENDSLKSLSGRYKRVKRVMLAKPGTEEFVSKMIVAIEALPASRKTRRVAIGCSAGRHRSVAVVEIIAERLRSRGHTVIVKHLDLKRAMTNEPLRRFL